MKQQQPKGQRPDWTRPLAPTSVPPLLLLLLFAGAVAAPRPIVLALCVVRALLCVCVRFVMDLDPVASSSACVVRRLLAAGCLTASNR